MLPIPWPPILWPRPATGGVGRQTDDGSVPHRLPGADRGHVVLADVDPVRTDGRGQPGVVVEHEWHVVVGADPLDQPGPLGQRTVGQTLLAQLHDVHAACDAGLHEGLEVRPVRGAQVEPPLPQVPPVRRTRCTPQRPVAALPLARAFIFCLYWRTLASVSGESMSATDRNDPASP